MAVKTSKKDKNEDNKKENSVVSVAERRNLRNWNLRLAFLLAAQAVAIVLIGGSQTAPLTTEYLATDALASEAAGHQVLAVATRQLLDVPLTLLAAKFLLIFAVVYLLAATLWRGKYEAWLERGVNKLRWAAFGLGGGAMAAAVAMLSGVSNVAFLALIAASVVLAAMSALAIELLGPGRRLRRLMAAAAVLGAALPWVVFVTIAVSAALFNGSLPDFVYYIYISMFLLTSAVGLAGYLRVKQRGKWASTVYTERMCMLLGFVAASVLAWQVFAGAL